MNQVLNNKATATTKIFKNEIPLYIGVLLSPPQV